MNIIICGPAKGTEKKYACICCHREFDDIEQMAVSLCWDCVTGNLDCESCIETGVPFDRFSEPDAKLHKFVRWTNGSKSTAVGVCGAEVPYDDLGQGIAVLENCTDCWKEEGNCHTDSESQVQAQSGR